jgi:hypothetical protein
MFNVRAGRARNLNRDFRICPILLLRIAAQGGFGSEVEEKNGCPIFQA